MTLTAPPPAAPQEPAPAAVQPVAPPQPIRTRRPGRPDAAGAYGTALLILAALVFGLLLDVGPIGEVRHTRDRETSYAALRKDLAEGTVPVGQTDSTGALLRPGRPVALLTIPQLGLREVILEGTTSGVLAQGVGHRRDTPLPGQSGTSVLMGRQSGFGGPFGQLADLRPSETFTVLTGQGTQTFRVLDVRRAGDPVPPALAAGAGRLVLVTADGPAFTPDGLLLVDADLVGKAVPAPARPLGADGLSAAEKPMGTDPSAWVPLVLWAEALLLAAVAVTLARLRWGRWQAWICGVPVLGALGLSVADQVVRLLPNLV